MILMLGGCAATQQHINADDEALPRNPLQRCLALAQDEYEKMVCHSANAFTGTGGLWDEEDRGERRDDGCRSNGENCDDIDDARASREDAKQAEQRNAAEDCLKAAKTAQDRMRCRAANAFTGTGGLWDEEDRGERRDDGCRSNGENCDDIPPPPEEDD
ncbi:MAG: hypothetical protein ABIG71_02700 [Candidatus Uhrbacteria bacterium]